MDRRLFLGSAASAIVLPGCATVPDRTGPRKACLMPVQVSSSRVIRTVAGLRPYRASGFVVRTEPLGDKRLVHNYGHGGAGITLSWGSSRLAVDLGIEGHSGPVAVIGAGIMGLTTARLVQEAGFPVTLYAEALPPETTSNIAGGQISPFGHYRDDRVSPQWRTQFERAMDYSWRRFQIMVGDDYGLKWVQTYEQSGGEGPSRSFLSRYRPDEVELVPGDHPFPVDHVIRYNTLYAETGRLLRQLARDVQLAGGTLNRRTFASPADLAALEERLIFNCTGLGSRRLFGDTELQPVRGQLAILLPQAEVNYAFSGEAGYMFPRADGILLGGTFERDVWDSSPQPADIERIIVSHRRLFGSFRCSA